MVPNRMNPNRSTPSLFIIKVEKLKNKERLLKAEREKKKN